MSVIRSEWLYLIAVLLKTEMLCNSKNRSDSYRSVTTTISGVLPVRMEGPHVPAPFVVYKV